MLNLVQVSFVRKIKTNFTSLNDVLLFVQVFILATLLPLLLRYLPVPRLLEQITPKTKTSVNRNDDAELIRKLVKYTDYVLSWNILIYHPNCLRRSLVLYHFLRKAGMDVQICLGAKFSDVTDKLQVNKILEGHAWLKYDGRIILERKHFVLHQYKVTYQFPNISGEILPHHDR